MKKKCLKNSCICGDIFKYDLKHSINDIIEEHGIEIDSNPSLPQQICHSCFYQLGAIAILFNKINRNYIKITSKQLIITETSELLEKDQSINKNTPLMNDDIGTLPQIGETIAQIGLETTFQVPIIPRNVSKILETSEMSEKSYNSVTSRDSLWNDTINMAMTTSSISNATQESLKTSKSEEIKMKFQCDKCGLNFNTKEKITKHIELHCRVHKDRRPVRRLKCSQCEKSFTQRSNLKIHEMIHNGEK